MRPTPTDLMRKLSDQMGVGWGEIVGDFLFEDFFLDDESAQLTYNIFMDIKAKQ